MNQLPLPLEIADQDYFTVAELAKIAAARGLSGFPGSERRVRDFVECHGWNNFPANLARQRARPASGRPAMEYHLSILPEIMQQTISGMTQKAQLIQRVADEGEAGRRKLDALRLSQLSARARGVLEARAEILQSIEGYAVSHGRPRSWGISEFLTAQDQWRARQEIERRRDDGQILTAREADSLATSLTLTSPRGFDLDPRTLSTANARRVAPIIKRASIFGWFKARDGQGISALAPVPTNAHLPVPDEFSDFLRFYAKPGKPDITDAHAQYLKAAETPGLHRVPLTLNQVKYILRNRMNNIERAVGREGLLTLRSRLPYVTRTTDDMWPSTIYSADGKTFDAEVADPVTKRPIRPEITTVIDIVTRKIVGISLARSENQRSVAEALRNSCCWNGIPAIFYVDRGPGYRNEAMDADIGGLMGRLGITKSHAAPYGSQAKGRIEIVNKTVWNTLAKRLPTYIGQDMDKEAGQRIHKITRQELKEFGASRHLPSWEEFVGLCRGMVEEYNAKPHSSLPKFRDPDTGKTRHMSPNECWAAHVAGGFEAVPVDADEADDLFRPYEIRTARRAQVEWNTNQYFHQALEAYHQEKVMVGYDYHQADRVWVREYDMESGQPGALICVAVFAGNAARYFPKSYEQAAIEKRAMGRLRRIEDKRAAVEAERDGFLQIEHTPGMVADFVKITPDAPVHAIEEADNVTPIPAPALKPKIRTFASDECLAVWALENPDQLNPNQIAVLRRCMQDSTARKLFELSGIDLEALRNLLRAAA